MPRHYRTINKCRVCEHNQLFQIMSLGKLGVVGFSKKNKSPINVPLNLVFCPKCHLLQLKQTTNAHLLWNEEYGYQSGINNTIRRELLEIVQSAEELVKLNKQDIVMDIGCNDGTLLQYYKNPYIHRVGFDPSHNVISIANGVLKQYGDRYFTLFVDFFNSKQFLSKFKKGAKIITAIAMFYDLNNPGSFLEDINTCLDQNGLFIIQQNYLMGMLTQNAFDNILHEHLEYYSLHSLTNLLSRYDLEVFDTSQNNINGGSFRTYIRKKGSKLSTKNGLRRVEKMMDDEHKFGITNIKTYRKFKKRINLNTKKLQDFIENELSKGKKIFVYGASTRGNTLLHYCKLNSKHIQKAAERNPYKWGKKTVGTNIPIISEEEARNLKPDYFLVLPWYFKEEFIRREHKFLKNGGKLIFPLPKFEVFGY